MAFKSKILPILAPLCRRVKMGFKVPNSWPKIKQFHNLLKLVPKMAIQKAHCKGLQ